MNAIQKYLIGIALDAARNAAGTLVATNTLSPVLIGQSLEELTEAMELLVESTESKFPCEHKYAGTRTNRHISPNGIGSVPVPIFVKPSPKNEGEPKGTSLTPGQDSVKGLPEAESSAFAP